MDKSIQWEAPPVGDGGLSPSQAPGLAAETPERPIHSRSQDVLGRDGFVERLCAMLIDDNSRQATGVVVAVTGEWGSGKSSVLNLVDERIREKYADAVVVRFNPWLVSARADLIAEFLTELTASIQHDLDAASGEHLVEHLAHYAQHLAAGPARATSSSLHARRRHLFEALEDLASPVVVLVDELDRVDDQAIRTMAQIVRSIADFPSISYLLAYDANRVIEALGASAPQGDRLSRGRDYLEKIVQLHIQLPVSFREEIEGLFLAELNQLDEAMPLDTPDWQESERFQALKDLLMRHALMETPRDVKRIVGIFQALHNAVRTEVEWEDILGVSALQAKEPQILERIRQDPEVFVTDPLPAARGEAEAEPTEGKLKRIFGPLQIRPGVVDLLEFLFPALAGRGPDAGRTDAVAHRRPLLTLLRLGLLPGRYSGADIAEFFHSTKKGRRRAKEMIKRSVEESRLGAFLDRFQDLYDDGHELNERNTWIALSEAVEKSRRALPVRREAAASYPGMVADLFARFAARSGGLRAEVPAILRLLIERNSVHVPAEMIRHHMIGYGMYGNPHRPQDVTLLTPDQTQELAHLAGLVNREHLLAGRLLPRLWEITVIHNMADLGLWDRECRAYLTQEMEREAVLSALVLWMYGTGFAMPPSAVGVLVDADRFFQRVGAMLATRRFERFDPTLKTAYLKAAGLDV